MGPKKKPLTLRKAANPRKAPHVQPSTLIGIPQGTLTLSNGQRQTRVETTGMEMRRQRELRGRNGSAAGTPTELAGPSSGASASGVALTEVQLNAWFHDPRTDPEDAMVDMLLLPNAKDGDIASVEKLVGGENRLCFRVRESHRAKLALLNGAQVLIQQDPLARLLGLSARSPVVVRVHQPSEVEADLVEVYVRDVHLARGDMWHFLLMLQGQCVYRTKKVVFADAVRCMIDGVYCHGKRAFLALVGKNTKVVFRSALARLTFMVQTLREMWHFEESGEIMFHKLINAVFPSLFKQWQQHATHHVITIVLFSSVDIGAKLWALVQPGELIPERQDYYRVVVDQVNVIHWTDIMSHLRTAFAGFMKEVLLGTDLDSVSDRPPQYISKGKFLPAVQGNVLEAINMAAAGIVDAALDPDLRYTNTHFVVITAGTGLYDVDPRLLAVTSDKMARLDAMVDIVLILPPPLHALPLFRYLDPSGALKYALPLWADILYWRNPWTPEESTRWRPRCKMYELQMMGVMENDSSALSIEPLKPLTRNGRTAVPKEVSMLMDRYDHAVFKSSDASDRLYLLAPGKPPLTPQAVMFAPSASKQGPRRMELIRLMVYSSPGPGLPGSPVMLSFVVADTSTVGALVIPMTQKTDIKGLATLSIPQEQAELRLKEISQPRISSLLRSALAIFPGGAKAPEGTAKDSPDVLAVSDVSVLSEEPSKPEWVEPPQVLEPPVRAKSPLMRIRRGSPEIRRQSNGEPRADSRRPKLPKKWLKTLEMVVHTIPSLVLWTEVLHPFKDLTGFELGLVLYGRWMNVVALLRRNMRRSVRWRLLTTPAALPLTTLVFPLFLDLQARFTLQQYDLMTSGELLNGGTPRDLFRLMVYARLERGFQICVGPKVQRVEADLPTGGSGGALVQYLPRTVSVYGAVMYLSFGRLVHRLVWEPSGSINVQIRMKQDRIDGKEGEAEQDTVGEVAEVVPAVLTLAPYAPLIRTRYAQQYTPALLDLVRLQPAVVKWNQIDSALAAGSDEQLVDANKHTANWLKLVLLPREIPQLSIKKNGELGDDGTLNQEEVRLEGLQKLMETIHRGRVRGGEGYDANAPAPEIYFYTGNLYGFLGQHAATIDWGSSGTHKPEHLLFTNGRGRLNTGSLLLQVVGEIRQPVPQGVAFLDRRWHLMLHRHCILGSDLVTWLVERFDDLDTREQAVAYGSRLLEQGVLKHVTSRHGFLDGHYFYYMRGEEAEEDREGGEDEKVETVADPPAEVELSGVINYNCDAGRKLFKPEVVRVHYDRVHNPEHCFHIRLEWSVTTPKLIDDTVLHWSRMCERYGLRLAEVPWREATAVAQAIPFHSHVTLPLALDPWGLVLETAKQIVAENRLYFHIFLLERYGFILDNRDTSFFAKDGITVKYTWGSPLFRHMQFVHQLGAYLAEVLDSGALFLAPNNRYIARVNALFLGQVPESARSAKPLGALDAQAVMEAFAKVCHNPVALAEVYAQAEAHWAIPIEVV